MNSVLARVGEPAAGDHHHESRLVNANAVVPFIRLAHKVAYLEKVACTFFDLTVSQLEFNQGKASVREVQDAVGLKTVPVSIIRKASSCGRRISPQVPYAQRLENEPERLEV